MPSRRPPSAVPAKPRVSEEALAAARGAYEGDAGRTQVAIAKAFGMTPGTLAYHARLRGWVRAQGALRQRRGTVDRRGRLVARLYRAFERQVSELERRLGTRLAAERAAAAGDPEMGFGSGPGPGPGSGPASEAGDATPGPAGGEMPARAGRGFDERDARLLATLAQTLHRLVALDAARAGRDAAVSGTASGGTASGRKASGGLAAGPGGASAPGGGTGAGVIQDGATHGAPHVGAADAGMTGDGAGGIDCEADLEHFRRSLARRLEALVADGDRTPAGGAEPD